MNKKLVFGELVVSVYDCYTFRYQNGDTVLRFSARNSNLEDLRTIENYSGKAQLLSYENVLLNEFDITEYRILIDYRTGNLANVEVMMSNLLTKKIEALQKAVDELTAKTTL